ncbi:MAG: transcriptional regulator [Hyphomicrobium sp.]|nr:MAG: transcriptional regulator [Hyphomicrobium sp.]PPC98265.1 MAG: transcriptional regulator [Hyphomicrobium sp.]
MITLESLGRMIAKRRGSQGLRAAAAEIGISSATLSRVENGHLPDLENFKKICDWLGVDVSAVSGAPRIGQQAVAHVHFKRKKEVSQETALALAEMILAAQRAASSRR